MKTLYHGTEVKNLVSIQKSGIKPNFGEVYLTDSKESAVKWLALRSREKNEVAVITVAVDETKLEPGMDHSQFMLNLTGGESFVYPEMILPEAIIETEVFEYNIAEKDS